VRSDIYLVGMRPLGVFFVRVSVKCACERECGLSLRGVSVCDLHSSPHPRLGQAHPLWLGRSNARGALALSFQRGELATPVRVQGSKEILCQPCHTRWSLPPLPPAAPCLRLACPLSLSTRYAGHRCPAAVLLLLDAARGVGEQGMWERENVLALGRRQS
jgi:hypothetical protein